MKNPLDENSIIFPLKRVKATVPSKSKLYISSSEFIFSILRRINNINVTIKN